MAEAEEKRILLVEDDRDLARIVKINLEDAGYSVECCFSGSDGLGKVIARDYDLLLLDLSLPEIDGLEVCRRIREVKASQAIVMLTSRKADQQKLAGFQAGADDYVTKPFNMEELLARVAALIRRSSGSTSSDPAEPSSSKIQAGNLSIWIEKRKVEKKEAALDLTATEFDLLVFLASHPGRAFSRGELMQYVWGYEYSGYDNTVNVHINRIRSKIEDDASNPVYLQTVWGIGYRFAESAELKKAA